MSKEYDIESELEICIMAQTIAEHEWESCAESLMLHSNSEQTDHYWSISLWQKHWVKSNADWSLVDY